MNHQPFEDWILNMVALTLQQQRELDSHVRSCGYCSALARTNRVLRSVKMAIPSSGFVERFQVRLAAAKALDRRRTILGLMLFTLGGLAVMGWLTSPYLA